MWSSVLHLHLTKSALLNLPTVCYVNACLFQIFAALNTLDTRQDTIKQLLDEKQVIVDEVGNTHELVNMGGLRFPTKLFETQERLFQNTKETVIQEDDVFLATYPKTGK